MIELDDVVTFKRAGHEMTLSTTGLTSEIVARLVIHGLAQKVGDSAAGKDGQPALDAMNATFDSLVAGDWGRSRGGDGVSEFVRVARQIVRNAFKAKHGAKSAQWAEFTGLEDDEQNDRLDAMFAKNEAALRPAVEAEIARRAEERKRKDALAKKTGALDL
jgi:hypothetical protein